MMIYILILIMTIMGSVASLFLKKASGFKNLKQLLLNFNLYIGGFLYLGGAILNIIVLRKLDYSIVLPLTSFTYVWTMIISYLFLKENISIKKIVGVVCIVLGAIVIVL